MAISLYDASVLSYLQILDATKGFLQKGLDWSRDQGRDPDHCPERQGRADA